MTKINCHVLRDNGSCATIKIDAGKEGFELDGKKYELKGFYIEKKFGIPFLHSFYMENYPLPIKLEMKDTKEYGKLKIDGKGITNLTNTKILNVFGEAEFTRLEMVFIFGMIATIAISAINLVLNFMIINKLGGI